MTSTIPLIPAPAEDPPDFVTPVTARAAYYAALEEANGGNLAPFEALVTDRVRAGVLELLAVLEDEPGGAEGA